MSEHELKDKTKAYYSGKFDQFGPTNKGVDWSSPESQIIRFEQLLKIINIKSYFTIADIGCGYGALFQQLLSSYENFTYTGFDLVRVMIESAKTQFSSYKNARFIVSDQPDKVYDFNIASGIFNVSLDIDKIVWKKHFISMLNILNQHSRLGFAFNCLTSYADPEYIRPDLYYADPCEIFHYCKKNFSRHITLLHDYGLYEFTMLVRKS